MIEKQSIVVTYDTVLIGVHFTEYALLYPFYKLLVKALPVIITRPYQNPAASFRYSRLGHLSRIAQSGARASPSDEHGLGSGTILSADGVYH